MQNVVVVCVRMQDNFIDYGNENTIFIIVLLKKRCHLQSLKYLRIAFFIGHNNIDMLLLAHIAC